MEALSYSGLFPHLSVYRLFTLAGWAGRDRTGRLTRPESPPIMNRNNLPVFTPEGSHAANANAGDLPPGPVLPNEGDPSTTERLFIMLQDLARSIAILTEQQKDTQARLDTLTRTLAGLNPPNSSMTVNQLRSYQSSSPHQQPSFHSPQEQVSKKPNSRTKNRHFSCLPTSSSQVLATLQAEGILQPLAHRVPPNPVPLSWNINEHCTYHQGYGHSTNNCFALRHAIQDLIDAGKITFFDDPSIE